MELGCEACGAAQEASARFCTACGAALFRVCSRCGAEHPATARFCSACGTALRGAEPPEAAGAPDTAEERRVVTVLFADLAGSTALGERLDPEDVRLVQTELYELLNGEVERHGGITEKFVGDAVVAVFGFPQTHEDDPVRAVRAGLALQEAFPGFAARVRDRFGLDVGLRVGVNTGDVVAGREAAARGEHMVSGDAVNVAARLQQHAAPGQVLAGARTRAAAQRAVRFTGPHYLDAKGKEEPLESWIAAGLLDGGRQGSAVLTAPLVGRDVELALLEATALRVRRDRAPQLVTVYGSAGVGKSRLIEELTTRLEGTRVLTGRCVPYGDGITYLPLVEVASSLAGILDDDPRDVAHAKLRAFLETVVPRGQLESVLHAIAWMLGLVVPGSTAGLGSGGDPAAGLRRAWALTMAALGRDAPTVIVIEDLHWASAELVELLEELVSTLDDAPVLVVCLARPELVEAYPTWGAGKMNVSALTLTPLGQSEAGALLRALLGTAVLPPEVERRILGPAEGNPFFVEEMLSMFVEQGALEQRGGVWTLAAGSGSLRVPDSVQGVIAARLDLLEPPAREALRRCSVMGRVFWPSAVGVDDGAIAALGQGGLVSERPVSVFSGRREFAFKHALTHDVAYDTLPRAERRDLHLRVAEWLHAAVPDRHAESVELVAYHYEQALRHGTADDELQRRAFDALSAAGDAALARGAYPSAERLLGRALELAPDEDSRLRTLLTVAATDTHRSNYDRAVERLNETIAAAERTGNAPLRADALGAKARASWLRGDWREAHACSREATRVLEGLPESAELARALARHSQIEMLRGLPSAADTARRAIDVARRTGERAAEANARTNLFTAQAANSVMPEEADMRAIIELALDAGAPDEAVRALVNYLWSAATLGPLEPPSRVVDALLGKVGAGLAAQSYEQYLRFSTAALIYLPAGRWDEADAIVDAEPEPVDAATNRLVWFWVAAGLAFRRGDLERADRFLPRFCDEALASEESQRVVPMACVAVPRALLAGDMATIRGITDAVLALPNTSVSTGPSVSALARALAAAGERDRLERLLASVEGFAPAAGPGAASAVGRGLLALLDGRAGEAARLLGGAEDAVRGLGRHFEAACVALETARALEAAGDDAGAAAARERSARVLEPLGCVNPY